MKKPLKKNLTKLEEEKLEKNERAEAIEEVLATGDENRKKGNRAVAEVEKEKVKEEREKFAEDLMQAEKKRRFDDFDYLTHLRQAAGDYIEQMDPSDWPGWKVKLYVTKDEIIVLNKKPFRTKRGLLGIIISPTGKMFAKGMKASFDPKTDILAARSLAIGIEESLDYYSGQSERSGNSPTINPGTSG